MAIECLAKEGVTVTPCSVWRALKAAEKNFDGLIKHLMAAINNGLDVDIREVGLFI